MGEIIITKEYLRSHPNEIFVFGDNVMRYGKKGAASLRDEPNTYGFITKMKPTNEDDAFFNDSYPFVYLNEIKLLIKKIKENPDKIFLISKLGAGLANRFKIFEFVIEPSIKEDLSGFSNVRFLW